MNKLLLLVIILCAIIRPPSAAASDHDLEDALNSRFKGKVLILRHPAGNESLRYDAQGKPLHQDREGVWTVYGTVRVQKIELGKHRLRLHGTRLGIRHGASGLAALEFGPNKNPQIAPPVKPSVEVEIGFDEPLTSTDQAQAILANVFALNKADLLDSLPELWRSYLAAQLNDFDIGQGREIDFQSTGSRARSHQVLQSTATQAATTPESHDQLGRVYMMGQNVPGIKPPKVTYSPEPEFTEAARYEKFQGVVVVDLVVGQDGKVRGVNLLRALGLGLDESAVATIKRWTFDPAMLNGEPVSMKMNVEVAFNLY